MAKNFENNFKCTSLSPLSLIKFVDKQKFIFDFSSPVLLLRKIENN